MGAVPLFGHCIVCWRSSSLTTLATSGDVEGTGSFLFMDTDYYLLHRVLRRIASWGVYSFFTEVRVIGGENVPANGPVIVYVYLLNLRGILHDDNAVPACRDDH